MFGLHDITDVTKYEDYNKLANDIQANPGYRIIVLTSGFKGEDLVKIIHSNP